MFSRLQARLYATRQRITGRASDSVGHITQRDREIGDAANPDLAANNFEILFSAFQQMCGYTKRLVPHFAGSDVGRRSRCHRDPAVRRADAKRDRCSITGCHSDDFDVTAELFCNNLGEHGVRALTDSRRTAVDVNPAGRTDADGNRFKRPATRPFDIVGEPDADVAPFIPRRLLPRAKLVPAGMGDRLVLALGIVAAVKQHWHAAPGLQRLCIGHRIAGNQITSAHLSSIEAQLAGNSVHQALSHKCRLRMAGAPNRRHRHFVRKRESDVHPIGRHVIG